MVGSEVVPQKTSVKVVKELLWRSQIRVICVIGLQLFLVLILVISGSLGSASAQTATEWQDITTEVAMTVSNPIRSRRSPDATVRINIVNTGDESLSGAVRIVFKNIRPVGRVSIAGAVVDNSGNYVLDISSHITSPIPSGENVEQISVVVTGGGRVSFGFDVILEQQTTIMPTVNITSPASLVTLGASPLLLTGNITPSSGILTINGIEISHSSGVFTASVALEEGLNTIVARVVDSGQQITDSISVSLDLTPPYITVESHVNNQTVYTDKVTVTGLINDIVRGTVEAAQANLTVNGKSAIISNRSYAVTNVPLNEGANVITVIGADQVGNVNQFEFNLNYEIPVGRRIELVSGEGQSATINTVLSAPLMVRVLDDALEPVSNIPVIFRVMQGSGVVASGTEYEGRAVVVTTNEQGVSRTYFTIGSRSGVANHKVRAQVVGYESEVVFSASATSEMGNKLSVNSGNNQRGVIGQILPAPLVSVVTDAGANVVAGARVQYQVTVGGGKFSNGLNTIEVQTDSDGRARVQLTLGELLGLDAQRITATLLDALAGQTLTAGYTATAFVPGAAGQTSINGVILDNQDTPIPGVTIRIDGSTRQAVTDLQGQFVITEAPIGPVHLIVDGSTATIAGEFPALSYNIVTISGVENPLSAPIYMVKLNTDNAILAGSQAVSLTLDKYPGFQLDIAQGSVTFPDGSHEGNISVTAVNASKVPMAPPNGMQPQFIVTIQPTGATFDPPARLSLPNFDGHAAGAQVEMYSYDHDLEEFVSIGLGSVSEDGLVIKSNPGIGVIKAGWHCGSQPGGSGCTHNCGECQECTGECNCVTDDNKIPTSIVDVEGDCKKPGCQGGSAAQLENDSDLPENTCKTCTSGSIDNQPDGFKPDSSNLCKYCEAGELKDVDTSSWKDDSGLSSSVVAPDQIKNKIQNIINKIPRVNITLTEIKGAIAVKAKDCCNPSDGVINTNGVREFEVSGELVAVLRDFQIWPPGVQPISVHKFFNLPFNNGVQVDLLLEAGVFFESDLSFGGKWGKRESDCNSDENCQFAAISTNLTATLKATAQAMGCVDSTFTQEYCTGVIEITPGAISAQVGGNVGYNSTACNTGLDGSFTLGKITFSTAINIPGLPSFSYNYEIFSGF